MKTWTDYFTKLHRKEIENAGWIRLFFRRNDGRCNRRRVYYGDGSGVGTRKR